MIRNPMPADQRTVVDLLLVTWEDDSSAGECQ